MPGLAAAGAGLLGVLDLGRPALAQVKNDRAAL
jgi:hypothetical protein